MSLKSETSFNLPKILLYNIVYFDKLWQKKVRHQYKLINVVIFTFNSRSFKAKWDWNQSAKLPIEQLCLKYSIAIGKIDRGNTPTIHTSAWLLSIRGRSQSMAAKIGIKKHVSIRSRSRNIGAQSKLTRKYLQPWPFAYIRLLMSPM